jgi:hypothetical protein
MGRELRMVPENWEHPKNENGNEKPLLGGSFTKELADYKEGKQKWNEGLRENWFPKKDESKWNPKSEDEQKMSWEEWTGEKPDKQDYMPEWSDKEKTHFQMYETCTEGTPISPVMDSIEKLAHWLADNKASAFGDSTATYDQWLNTIKAGSAVSAIMTNGVIDSGVAHA